jgi:hypothetical protein
VVEIGDANIALFQFLGCREFFTMLSLRYLEGLSVDSKRLDSKIAMIKQMRHLLDGIIIRNVPV